MGKHYQAVLPKIRELSLLNASQALLGWDQEVMMPKAAAADRGDIMAAQAGVVHEKMTDPKLGEMLKAAKEETDLNPYEQANIRETLRSHEKALKIPQALITELTKLTSQATHVWADARGKSDFPLFAPWLEKILKLSKQIAEHVGYAKVPYDALLDEYDPGATVESVSQVLMPIRDALHDIVAKIAAAPKKPNKSILERHYDIASQEKVSRELVKLIGFKLDEGRLDISTHPFCSGTGIHDVRLTTRYMENWLPSATHGAIHEAGHGIYEQGLNHDYAYTPAGDAAWMSVHESQSRFWENTICRSHAFWEFYFPKLQTHFPDALMNVGLDDFYGAINFVEPSLIRVEADEVTYGLHLIIRFEIEKALFDGSIKVTDLPAIWNQKVKDLLGIAVPNDKHGVLQDVHWSFGGFGYFQTYLMGNLYAAQWNHYMRKDLPVDDHLRKGDCLPIRTWLNEKIHREGRCFRARDLVKHVTGEGLNPNYFVTYLKEKFGPIYNVVL